MKEKIKMNNRLDFMLLGETYFQVPQGIMKEEENEKPINIGKMYIHQMTIKRDVNDRYEPLYSIKYDDLIFNELKIIENKTFDELVNFVYKQQLIYEKKNIIADILKYNLIYNHGTVNGVDFIIKKEVDFEHEKLPMIAI